MTDNEEARESQTARAAFLLVCAARIRNGAAMKIARGRSLLAVTMLAGVACSRGGYEGMSDGALPEDLTTSMTTDMSTSAADGASDGAMGPDLLAPPDLQPGPTAAQCLEGWRKYGGACPAPQISASYVANGCVGTTGWFVDGQNFQLEMHNVGIADYGPQSFGANGDQKHWNVITTTRLCVTVSAAAKSAWVGHTIYVKNPDGKSSNSVVVQDRL